MIRLRRDPAILAMKAYHWACQQTGLWTTNDLLHGAGLLHRTIAYRLVCKMTDMGILFRDRTDRYKHSQMPHKFYTKWRVKYDPDWELHLMETILKQK